MARKIRKLIPLVIAFMVVSLVAAGLPQFYVVTPRVALASPDEVTVVPIAKLLPNDTTGDSLSGITGDDATEDPDSLSKIVTTDNVYTVDTDLVMHLDTFEDFSIPEGATIRAVVLHLEYGAQDGYNGTNPVRYDNGDGDGLKDTTIIPTDFAEGGWRVETFDLKSVGVDTEIEIENVDIEFTNNDGQKPGAIHFDYLWITVNYSFETSVTQGITITDGVAVAVERGRDVSQDITITDGVTATSERGSNISQDITITDGVTAATGRSREVSQGITITDVVTVTVERGRDVSQGITITDGVTATSERGSNVSQDITISDGVTAAAGRSRNGSQDITITDGVTATVMRGRDVSQDITITDGVTATSERGSNVSQDITITDVVTVAVNEVTVTESILVSDVVTVTIARRGGGGGGGGVVVRLRPVWAVDFIDISGYLDARGRTTVDITLTSADGLVTIFIPLGTNTLDARDKPLGSMEVIALSPPPAAYNMVGPAYDFLPSGATFKPYITLALIYDEADIPEGASEEDLGIAYYDGAKWVFLPTIINLLTNTASANVEHFAPFAILAKLPTPPSVLPAWKVSNLSISPSEVEPGQKVTISAAVENTGGVEGVYEATLMIDGVVETTKKVIVAAGVSRTVSFSVSRDEPDTYKVALDGLSGAFVVAKPVPPAPAPPPVITPPVVPPPVAPPGPNWALIGGIIAAVVLITVLVVVARPKIALFVGRITSPLVYTAPPKFRTLVTPLAAARPRITTSIRRITSSLLYTALPKLRVLGASLAAARPRITLFIKRMISYIISRVRH